MIIKYSEIKIEKTYENEKEAIEKIEKENIINNKEEEEVKDEEEKGE